MVRSQAARLNPRPRIARSISGSVMSKAAVRRIASNNTTYTIKYATRSVGPICRFAMPTFIACELMRSFNEHSSWVLRAFQRQFHPVKGSTQVFGDHITITRDATHRQPVISGVNVFSRCCWGASEQRGWQPALLRVGISDGKVEKVADLKNVRPASSIFGAWSGLAPDDSPLLLRDMGTKEIFALDWQEP